MRGPWEGEWRVKGLLCLLGDVVCDAFAVEAAVFDEDLAADVSRQNDSSDVESGNVAFQCFGIVAGDVGGGIEGDAHTSKELHGWGVAELAKNEIVFNGGEFVCLKIPKGHGLPIDAFHHGAEVAMDFVAGEAVFDVGLEPVLHALTIEFRASVG